MNRINPSTGYAETVVSWKQIGLKPIQSVEERRKFVKEAFGMTDEEIEALLKSQE